MNKFSRTKPPMENEGFLITERKPADLEFLNSLAFKLAELPSDVNLVEFLMRQIKEFTGAVLAVYSEYNEAKQAIITRHIEAGQIILQMGIKIIGGNIINSVFPVDRKTYQEIVSQRIGVKNSFHEVTFGAIPKSADKALKAFTGISIFYGIGFVVAGELFGTSVLAFKDDQIQPSVDMLESFAHLSAVSLRRKKAEEALIQSEKKYRLFFESNPLPMWIYDLDTLRFLEVNNAAIENYGYSRQEFLQMTLKDIRPESDVKSLLENIESTKDEYSKTNSWKHKKKDGKIIYVEIISYQIDYEGKKARLVLANDMTDRIIAQEELIQAKKEAEKSDKLKSEFLAQMSHEIRSPINTMLNFISLIKEEISKPLNDEMAFSFNAIDSSSRRLIRTIDLILNMSQVQTGYLECSYQEIDLERDILKNVINEYSTSALLKGLALNFFNEYGTARIKADSYTMTQIFSNLINNAIKYTKTGTIVLRVYRDSGNNICVDVSDTGIGISEHYIDQIFTPFSQEEQGYTRRFEGNGLGLALVKKYCELNNAKISVKSKKGKGSTFTVTISP